MFFEIVNCVGFLTIFDQNPANHVKENSTAAPVRNVQDRPYFFYKP